jgi:hypothetical protein
MNEYIGNAFLTTENTNAEHIDSHLLCLANIGCFAVICAANASICFVHGHPCAGNACLVQN